MNVDENLIREALVATDPSELENVLAAIEAYRVCVATAQKLVGASHLRNQRQQVLQCALYCKDLLAGYAAGQPVRQIEFPPEGSDGDFKLTIQ